MKEPQETTQPERPVFMHPAVFIGSSVLVGLLFALQEYLNARRWGYKIALHFLSEMWGMQFLLWGVICWLLWRFLRSFVVNAGIGELLDAHAPPEHRAQHPGRDDLGALLSPSARSTGHRWITGTGSPFS